jgi:hypothetical protein
MHTACHARGFEREAHIMSRAKGQLAKLSAANCHKALRASDQPALNSAAKAVESKLGCGLAASVDARCRRARRLDLETKTRADVFAVDACGILILPWACS